MIDKSLRGKRKVPTLVLEPSRLELRLRHLERIRKSRNRGVEKVAFFSFVLLIPRREPGVDKCFRDKSPIRELRLHLIRHLMSLRPLVCFCIAKDELVVRILLF